jgi:DnaJ-class molecular chaperone
MDRRKDYYKLLGLTPDATITAIKRAYRRLAKLYHPDRMPDKGSEAFRELQQAYETLADAERRRRYDETLRAGARDGEWESPPWAALRGAAVQDLRRPVHPASLSGEILLRPEEAASGGTLPLDVPLNATCPACEGTGGAVFDCISCGGEGKVQRRLPVPVRIPPGVRDGTIFQVSLDDPAVLSIILTIHIRAI